MNNGLGYLKFGLAGVEQKLVEAAKEPIREATILAMAVQPGKVVGVDPKSWFEKLSSLSRESSSTGKRFRAKLAIISSYILGLPIEDAVRLGAFVELIQSASLVHDDVVDEAKTRRGKPTVNRLADNRFAVLTGDYILAQAISELHSLRNNDLLGLFSQVVSQMTFGEAMEIETTGNPDRSLEHYLATISLKTASLMAFTCSSACILSGSSKLKTKSLANFGFNLGMAFQLVDDVLDYVGPDGKEPGQDVKEGIVTMPVIMLSCKEGIFTDPFLKTLEKVSTENTLHKTISLAKDYSNRANASLKPVVGENMDGIELLSQINEDIYERLPSNLLQESKKHQWQTL